MKIASIKFETFTEHTSPDSGPIEFYEAIAAVAIRNPNASPQAEVSESLETQHLENPT